MTRSPVPPHPDSEQATAVPPTAAPGLRVLVAAGGTVGHVAPALEVAAELRDRGHLVTWIGSVGRAEEEMVPAAGFELDTMPVTWLPRTPGRAQIEAVARAGRSVSVARRVIARRRPHVLLTGGGYVILPVKLAARTRRVPFVATEADAHMGLANRIGIRRTARLCTTFPLPQVRQRQEVTGRPVARDFFVRSREEGRRRLDIPADGLVVSVVGGSGGALNLNRAAEAAWNRDTGPTVAGTPCTVVHVTGRRDHRQFSELPRSDSYRIMDFCHDMPSLVAASDLVIARAGASVFELAAAGAPAVLVPWAGAAGDHQRANARWFEEAGAALVAADDDALADRLAHMVDTLLAPPAAERLQKMSEAMRSLARAGAASRIAEIVEQVGDARRSRAAGSATESGTP